MSGTESVVALAEPTYGQRWLYCDGRPELIFTDNDTNTERLYGDRNVQPYVKDAFHRYVIEGARDAVNPQEYGTKAAAVYRMTVSAGATVTLRLRLSDFEPGGPRPFGRGFDNLVAARHREADEFYDAIFPSGLSADSRIVARQAVAGLLWSKQYYHYVVKNWLDGDAAQPAPPG